VWQYESVARDISPGMTSRSRGYLSIHVRKYLR